MIATSFPRGIAIGPRPALRAGIARALPVLIVVAAVLLQCLTSLDNDVSWLITVGEHMLDGQRLYVDIIETNPPASVLIYLPAIALARALGLPPEPLVAAFVFAFAALAIGGAARLLVRGGLVPASRRLPLLSATLFVLLLLPAAVFAQREQVALLALLPMMAVLALRCERRPVSLAAAIGAGFGAGLTMIIKPHFVLAIAPMILFAMARARSWRLAFGIENVIAAGAVLAYVGGVALAFPAYLHDVLPVLRAVYLPSRAPWIEVWFSAPMLLQATASVLAVWLTGRRIVASQAALPLIAATGFAAAAIVQGKGFLNHGYPGDALALLALAIVLLERHGDAGQRRFVGAAFVGLSALILWFFAHIFAYTGLAELVRRLAPPHPRIIVAGGDLAVGHPLTRWVGGEWVGRSHSLWVTADVMDMLERPPRPWTAAEKQHFRSLADEDAREFVDDVARGRPDVVLVEGRPGLRWIASRPAVAKALAGYRPAGEAADVFVWVRGAK